MFCEDLWRISVGNMMIPGTNFYIQREKFTIIRRTLKIIKNCLENFYSTSGEVIEKFCS